MFVPSKAILAARSKCLYAWSAAIVVFVMFAFVVCACVRRKATGLLCLCGLKGRTKKGKEKVFCGRWLSRLIQVAAGEAKKQVDRQTGAA
jgi:hypothetical protein